MRKKSEKKKSIAENLVNNQSCAKSFNFERFKAIKSLKKYF